MQCQRILKRQSCHAHNAYNASKALITAFSSTSPAHSDDTSIFSWSAHSDGHDASLQPSSRKRIPNPFQPQPSEPRPLKLTRQDRMAHLVQPDDLTATLEAHRKWNRGMHARREAQGKGRLTFEKSTGKEVKLFEKSFQRIPGQDTTYRSFQPIAARMVGDVGGESRQLMLPGTKANSLVGRMKTKPEYISSESPAPTNVAKHADRMLRQLPEPNRSAFAFDWDRFRAGMRELAQQTTTIRELPKNSRKLNKMAASLDYAPMVVPYFSPKVTDVFSVIPPWTTDRKQLADLSGLGVLSRQLHQFMLFMEADQEERKARQAVAEQFQQLIAQHPVGKSVTLNLFGSEVNGLASVTSDIDFCITSLDGGPTKENPRALVPLQRSVFELLKADPNWISAVGRWGKYPIVTAQHKGTGIDVQVVATGNTEKRTRATQSYLEEFPNLRKLHFLIRTILSMRYLGDTFTGGLGSYSTFMMIVAALKRSPDLQGSSAGEQLRHVLAFYSRFDTGRYGLAIEPRAHLFKKHRGHLLDLDAMSKAASDRGDARRACQWKMCEVFEPQPWLFMLQDPVDPSNDLGKRAIGIKHILRTFDSLHNKLESQLLSIDMIGEKADLTSGSLLLPMVGPCHAFYADRRRRVREWARSQNL